MNSPEGPANAGVHDAVIVARLQHGDATALADIAQTYGPALLRFAARIVGSADLAEDVLQDVLWRVWRQRAELDAERRLAPYLFRLMRNHAVDLSRSDRAAAARDARWSTEVIEERSAVANAGERALDHTDVRAEILRALAPVSARSREVFMLVWEENLSYADIAEMLGLSVLSVRNQMSRAVRRLAEVFGPRVRR